MWFATIFSQIVGCLFILLIVLWQRSQTPGYWNDEFVQSMLGLPWWVRWLWISLLCRRHGFNLWIGKIPWEGNGYLLQYSYLENFMDRGAWQATVHGVAKSWTQWNDFHFFHGPYSVSNHFKLVACFFNWDFYVKIWISGFFWKNRKSGLPSPDLPQSLPLSIVFPTLRLTVSHHLSLCLSCCFTYFALWGKQKQNLGPILFLSKGRRCSQKRMEVGVKKSAGLI